MPNGQNVTFDDLVEVTDIAWSVSRKLRGEAHHGGTAPCTPMRERGCRGRCHRTVHLLVDATLAATPGAASRQAWRAGAATTATRLCGLALGAVRESEGDSRRPGARRR